MDIKIICPSCNQHISADSAMRGQTIPCPACGESLRVPAKSQVTPRSSGVPPKQILWGLAIACFAIAAWISIHAFLQHRQQVRVAESRAARRTRMVTTTNGQPNRPRFSFMTNEMWLKPLNGDLDGVKEILDKNPQRLEERVGGMRATLLHIAAYGGQPRVVEELLRRNADVNVRTTQGHTPLYDCIFGRGTAEIAKMLLDAKCDFTIADNAGKTPLQLATERNKPDIADLLREYGAKK